MATQELQSQIERYVIRRVLGTGAMGSVYAAWDPKLHREVALKVVPSRLSREPKGRERFHREARAIAAVRHPNVVEIYDYSGADSPHLFLVIEKLDGQDLYATLHQQGVMGEAVAAAVGHELCLALHALHESGIIHRDLKPENVFLNKTGRVVLTDFGIVKAVREGAAVDGYRDSTDVIGTPGFMAPELMSGRGLGPASDIFALGVLLYNLATKNLPFEGATPLDIFKAAAAGSYPDPRKYAPTLSREFCDVIHACLRPNARQRPRSAEVVRQSLKAVIEELGAVDVRDDLQAYSSNSVAFEQFARQRAVRRVLAQVKIHAKDHDAAGVERFRRRLQVLDPFNEEIGEVSGVMQQVPQRRRPKAFAALRNMVTDRVQTLVETGVYSLQQMQDSLPRGAFLLAGLLVVVGGLGIFAHAQWQRRTQHSLVVAQQQMALPVPQAAQPTSPAGEAEAPTAARPAARAAVERPPLAHVDLRVSGRGTDLRLDGHALGRVRHRDLRLSQGRHVFEFMAQGHNVRRLLSLPSSRALDLRIDPSHRRLSVRRHAS